MNIKMKFILSVLAVSASVFAVEPVAPTAVRAADATAPVAADAETTPAEETPVVATEDASPAEAVPAEVAAPTEMVAPTAVRAADAAAPVETSADVTPVESAEPAATSSAAEVVAAPAPTTRRYVDPDTLTHVSRYQVHSAPVQTVYVAEKSGQDTVTLDELRGLVPLNFRLGAQVFIGEYGLTDYSYYDEGFADFTFRAGLTSILPLNSYTIALKLGAIYEQSEAAGTLRYEDRIARISSSYHLKFKQRKINVPLLFSFKSAYSNLMFDMGIQASASIYDKLSVSYTTEGKKHEYRVDMLDEGYRKSVDWDFVFGFEYFANKFLSLNVRIDYGFTSLYEPYSNDVIKVNDLSSSSFMVGCSFYFL